MASEQNESLQRIKIKPKKLRFRVKSDFLEQSIKKILIPRDLDKFDRNIDQNISMMKSLPKEIQYLEKMK